jgi:hypothetical protein
MSDELEILAQTLSRLIEHEQFAEAQAMLPEYTQALDRRVRESGGEEALEFAIATFHSALIKARTARAHISAELSDVNRARAYSAETGESPLGWQFVG